MQGINNWENKDPVAYQGWTNINFKRNYMPTYYSQRTVFTALSFELNTMSNASAAELKYSSMKTWFPYLDGRMQCTGILLTNLAEPLWVHFNCEQQLVISNVMCLIESDETYAIVNYPDQLIYDTNCVIQNNVCYIFWWVHNVMKGKRMTYNEGVYKGRISVFEFLFLAIESIFPPILNYNMKYYTTYKMYGNNFKYLKQQLTEPIGSALIVTYGQVHKHKISQNIFRCESDVYISVLYICDGKADCPNGSTLDEQHCQCHDTKNYSSMCKYLISNHSAKNNEEAKVKQCSSFYFRSVEGTCRKYTIVEFLYKIIEQVNFNNYMTCKNSRIIHDDLIGDLVSDCGENGEDENPRTLLSSSSCFESDQLPCVKGQINCYKISEICSYKLNQLHILLPCRTGGHLQNCSQFECNMMFKCPRYYCIPWKYVCDGKWDCPHGYDESYAQNCLSTVKCKNMFKCRHSNICIHVGDVCNGNQDCIEADDEQFCSLKDQV